MHPARPPDVEQIVRDEGAPCEFLVDRLQTLLLGEISQPLAQRLSVYRKGSPS